MRRPNHASRFEGIAKTNLQASRASDTETLQSQVNKAAKKRLSLSELEILHGRLLLLTVVQKMHSGTKLTTELCKSHARSAAAAVLSLRFCKWEFRFQRMGP